MQPPTEFNECIWVNKKNISKQSHDGSNWKEDSYKIAHDMAPTQSTTARPDCGMRPGRPSENSDAEHARWEYPAERLCALFGAAETRQAGCFYVDSEGRRRDGAGQTSQPRDFNRNFASTLWTAVSNAIRALFISCGDLFRLLLSKCVTRTFRACSYNSCRARALLVANPETARSRAG